MAKISDKALYSYNVYQIEGEGRKLFSEIIGNEEFADNDFLEESNEYIRQVTNVESVTKGGIDNITILDGGDGYKVGDLTSFDHDDTEGSGFSAEVSEIVGLGVSTIETTLTRFNNAVFTWNSGCLLYTSPSPRDRG